MRYCDYYATANGKRQTATANGLAFILAGLTVLGCGHETVGDDDEVGDGDGETGEPFDEPCLCEEALSWQCNCKQVSSGDWISQGYLCHFTEMGAADACDQNICTGISWTDSEIVGPAPCDDMESEMSCTGWDPASEVNFNSSTGTYELDWGFISGLFGDPEALWGCDDTTVLLGANGFVVDDADSGELLYELGLRDGDIIESLNGFDLDTFTDVSEAITELWLNQGATEFTLEIERNSSTVELDYELLFTI